MLGRIAKFTKETDGAVTVDWVLLTAAVMGMALVQLGAIGTALDGAATNVASGVTSAATSASTTTTP